MTWRLSTSILWGRRARSSALWRSAFVGVAVIAATASSAYAEMSGTSKSLASFNKHIESGAQVLVISGSGLGATECERLGSESGIVSSGSLDDRGVARWVADSSTPLPVGTVTRGWLELVGASVPPSASGWVIGSELADTLGLQRGDLFGVQGGGPPDPVIVVLPSGPRTERVGGWALDLIAPIGSVRSCWLEADGVRTDDAEMAALSVFAGAGNVDSYPLVREASTVEVAWLATAEHLGFFASLASLIPILMAAALTIRSRRVEFALGRSFGMTRSDFLWSIVVEVSPVVVTAAVAGYSAALASLLLTGSPEQLGVLDQTVRSAAWCAALPAVTMLAALFLAPFVSSGSAVDALKDR